MSSKKNTKKTQHWVSLRVSDVTKKQLEDLQRIWGENRGAVVRRCIERVFSDVKNSS